MQTMANAIKYKANEVVGYVTNEGAMSLYFIKRDCSSDEGRIEVIKMDPTGKPGPKSFKADPAKLRKIWLQVGDKVVYNKEAKMGVVTGFQVMTKVLPTGIPGRSTFEYKNCFTIEFFDHTFDLFSFSEVAQNFDLARS